MAPGLSQSKPSFPTVLVFGLDRTLVAAIRDEGYNVLEACTQTDLTDFVRCHSRPIHLLLVDMSNDNRFLAALLRKYRPTMRVLYVGHDKLPDVVPPEALGGDG